MCMTLLRYQIACLHMAAEMKFPAQELNMREAHSREPTLAGLPN